jgi:hypothetical protein
MQDNTSYVILSEIRDLLRQSVEIQRQTLAEVQKQVDLERSAVDPLSGLGNFFAELYGEHIESVRPQDNDNTEDEDN